MKRSIFLCLILLNIDFSFGQSIVTSNRLWYNYINYYAFPPPVTGIEHIKFTNDTTINSITYKKVERSLDETPNTWSSYGFIRENSLKQIFYKISASDTERLIYDLNVQAHNTILVYGLGTSYTYKNLDSMSFYVRNIDSILIGLSYRKRINLTIPEDTTTVFEQWIDSIGSLGGILHNRYNYVGGDYYSLLCFFEDGVLKFHDPNYYSCTYISGFLETRTITPTVSVFPNPVNDVLTFIIKGTENYNSIAIYLYNSMGKQVYKSIGRERIEISKSDLPSGVYFYYVSSDNSVIATGKVIIN